MNEMGVSSSNERTVTSAAIMSPLDGRFLELLVR